MQHIKSYSKTLSKKILLQIPFLKYYIRDHDRYIKAYAERFDEIGFEPGHYHSPIPNLAEVKEAAQSIFGNENIKDIDLNLAGQLLLLEKLKTFYNGIPYAFNSVETRSADPSGSQLRYNPEGAWYRYSDVIFLMELMQYYKPKRIIEAGSGHSSAVMLDANDIFFGGKIDFTFIEPFPDARLNGVLKETDRANVTTIESKIQEVDLVLFQSLKENDFLFIDSSHVSKAGSDVNHIFFNILPLLKAGVIIHFHDIFFPFELPKPWILEKKYYWNEIYLLRAFLMNNKDYEIILFNSLLHKKYRQWFEKEMPACLIGEEETGSLWIKKLKCN